MVYTLSSSTWIRFFLLSIIDGDLLKSALIPLCALPCSSWARNRDGKRSKCARREDTSCSATSQCGSQFHEHSQVYLWNNFLRDLFG